jgi:hypothetical protein
MRILAARHTHPHWPDRLTWRRGKKCVAFGNISGPKNAYVLMKFKGGFWEETGSTRALYKAMLWLVGRSA